VCVEYGGEENLIFAKIKCGNIIFVDDLKIKMTLTYENDVLCCYKVYDCLLGTLSRTMGNRDS
jgi:hypothetical protein